MKKIYRILLLVLLMFAFLMPVHADVYEVQRLIPVGEKATVNTEKFLYQDFVFTAPLDDTKQGTISFTSIKNNTLSKVPISINLLLFGEDKTNIGLVTYCSDKDFESDYSGFKLRGEQESAFSISVSKKYLEGDSVSKVFYVAVLDENKYCQIGNYARYKGQTIEEIKNGTIVQEEDNFIIKIISLIENMNININFQTSTMITIGIIVGAFILFLILGSILNSLHKKMYGKGTILAYLPVSDYFLTMKMAFGRIVGIISFVFFVISIGLFFLDIKIVLYIMGGLGIFAYIVDLLKLITGKHDLLYLEPSMVDEGYYNNRNALGNDLSNSSQPTLSLNYSLKDVDSLDDDSNRNNSDTLDDDVTIGNNDNFLDDDDDNKENNTDLTNFFR